ncbi:MAG TPA: hypothetical protein VHG30_11120 [Microvirga sp.]|nr:hypothetical protein [Microvirga sp.]
MRKIVPFLATTIIPIGSLAVSSSLASEKVVLGKDQVEISYGAHGVSSAWEVYQESGKLYLRFKVTGTGPGGTQKEAVLDLSSRGCNHLMPPSAITSSGFIYARVDACSGPITCTEKEQQIKIEADLSVLVPGPFTYDYAVHKKLRVIDKFFPADVLRNRC